MNGQTGQGRLFDEPKLARGALKEELLVPGGYDARLTCFRGRADVTRGDLDVYTTVLGRLRGASEWAEITLAEIAAASRLTERGVQKCTRHLEALGLIEVRRRRNKPNRYRFAPLDDCAYPVGNGPAERHETAGGGELSSPGGRTQFVPGTNSVRAGDELSSSSSLFTAHLQTPALPDPEGGDGAELGAGEPDAEAPEAAQDAPRSPRAPIGHPGEARADESAQRSHGRDSAVGVETSRAIDLADAWEESLGLDARPRDLEAMESDLGELFAVAADCLAGRLGAVGPCQNTLATLAHQIGRRDPRADRPLGMFLAEVKRLRIAAFLRRP